MSLKAMYGSKWRKLGAGIAAIAVVTTGLVLPAAAHAADPTALLDIRKAASTSEVLPGDTFDYTIDVSCSSITDLGCINAQLTDPVPAEFEILDVTVENAPHGAPVIDGQNVTVPFNEDLGGGVLGLKDNTTATVTISVRVRADLPYELSGVEIPNTATVSADNAAPKPATAPVVPTIPLELSTTAEKSFAPDLAQAAPGTETTLTLIGTNTSNAGVDALTLTDPVDPSAAGSPFDYLAITAVAEVVWPDGAENVVLEHWDGSTWIESGTATRPGAPNAPPSSATGIRVTFTGADGATIPTGASGGIILTLEQRDSVVDLTSSLTVSNTLQSQVALGDQTATGTADATYRIVTEPITVAAAKSFTPDVVFAGGATSVSLTGTNSGETSLDTLTIREPAEGEFDARLSFAGFTSAVVFPSGAETGELTFVYLDVTGLERSVVTPLVDGGAFPELPADFATLRHFEVAFASTADGPIVSGAESSITFDANVAEGLDAGTVIDNVVRVGGTSGTQTAQDDAPAALTIDERSLDVETQKRISPGTIWGYAGEVATLQLPTTLLPSSTTNAHSIIVNDPALAEDGTPAASDWWDHFRPTAVTKTDVPDGATLTVRYFDTTSGAWVTLPGADGIAGPTSFSIDIPVDIRDAIGGLQFEFINEDPGFSPGAIVQPNITTQLKESLPPKPEGADISVQNCSGASATAPGATAGSATVDPCPAIEILAPTPGESDLLEKEWISPADGLVTARSGEHATSRLHWSTGGRGGLEQMVIADTATNGGDIDAGPAASVEDTTFQAFNLVKVKAITPTLDPLIAYDRITAVQLWNGTSWVGLANAAVPYNGALPEISLTAAEQQSALGIRLVVEEYTDARANATAPDAPSAGSGVARSFENNRAIDLEWQIRDAKRVPTDGSEPVLGSETYNTGDQGDVNNTASATGFAGGAEQTRDVDSDIISILDRPLNVTVTKGWTGGPLGVPPEGTPTDGYPTSRVTVTAKNTTVAKVDTLSITDPAPGSATDPFDTFDLKDIRSISVPAGAVASESVVILSRDGGSSTTHTIAQATELTAADLADVTGIQIEHNGRIISTGASTLVMDLRLRATHRSDDSPVTLVDSPIANETEAKVVDPGGVNGVHEVTALDEAQIPLANLNIDVVTTKLFSPDTQFEIYLPEEDAYATEPWDPIRMNLTAQPSGSARTAVMTVTDETPTFWNTYRFVGFPSVFALKAPIEQVRVDALVGGTFEVAADGSLALNGASWQEGAFGAAPALPAGVDADDVRGLRFTFQRADGSQWENPANPLQSIPIDVKRRAYQVIDPSMPVPSSAAVNAAAPGEEGDEGGVFTNTVQAHVISAVNGAGATPLTADHDATAQAFYVAGGIEVVTRKTPVGSQAPGRVIPFKLTVTNSASADSGLEKSILNPVIVDTLPLNADGEPWLIFDEESTEPHYAYAYTQTATPSGENTRMPIDPALITLEEVTNASGEIIEMRFSFPDGTVMMPAETYVITINMMFRPGITAGTQVTNGFGISSDEPFEACNGVEGEVDVCGTDTTVYPTATGALRGQKFVKSDDTELGVNDVTNAANVCEPALDDFYAGNCVPVTKPLGTETWRERVTNTGTLEMDKVVTIDRLPTPGDRGAYVALPRGSEWQPMWVGALTPVTDAGYRTPESIEYYYSSADNPCTADLTPGAACPTDAWLALTDDVDPTQVKHIKTVFGFEGNHFLPGDVLGYTFQTRTPAVSPVANKDTVAWNTIAIGAQTVNADGDRIGDLLPTEGRRVGVALATGPVWVEKTTNGEGVSFAPEVFQVQLQCVVGTGTDFETVLDPIVATVSADQITDLERQLPWGAECTLADVAGANGETSSESGDAVTIGRNGEVVPVATVANTYLLSNLEVSKTVVGATDQDGELIAYGAFDFNVVCTFVGAQVWAEGFTASPMQFELSAGEDRVLAGLPSGAECLVTETNAQGAVTTSVVVGADGEPIDAGAEAGVTTSADAEATVSFTNTFELGAIALTKQVDGDAAELFPDTTTFEFAVLCVYGGVTVYETTVTLTKADATGGKIITIDTLPAGAECAVTETDAGGASSTVITPDTTDAPVAVGTIAEPVLFTAANTFGTGTLHVTKEILGEGASLWGTGQFEVTLVCTLNGADVIVSDGATRTFSAADGLEADYSLLPIGAECTLTESNDGGATTSQIVDVDGAPLVGAFVITDTAEPLQLRVQNTFDIGSIEFSKEITGDAAGYAPDEFGFDVICTVNGAQIDLGANAIVELHSENGYTQRIDGLLLGATCDVTEQGELGEFGETTRYGTPTTLVVAMENSQGAIPEEQIAVIENEYDYSGLSVTKTIDTDASEGEFGPFDFTLVCTSALGAPVTFDGGVTELSFTLEGGETFTAPENTIPARATCVISEVDSADADGTVIVGDNVTDNGDGTASVLVGTTTSSVEFTNGFDSGLLTVNKVIDGEGAALFGAGPFDFTAVCTYRGQTLLDTEFMLDPNAQRTFGVFPTGTSCIVEETATGGATSTAIDPTDGVVVISADVDATNAVTATNTFALTSIQVNKTVTGAAAGYAADEFLVDVVCTVRGIDVPLGADAVVSLNTANGFSYRVDGIPTGASCAVTEQGEVGEFGETGRTGTPADIAVDTVVDATEDVPAAQTAELVNDYAFSGLSITKRVDATADATYGPFDFTLSCTSATGIPVTFDGGVTELGFTLSGDESFTAPENTIPARADCLVTEVGSTADGVVVVGDNVTDNGDGSALIHVGVEAAAIEFTNSFDAGVLVVQKVVDGAGANLYGTGAFTFTAVCTYEGQTLLDDSFELAGGDQRSFGPYPTNTSCIVEETDAGNATTATLDPSDGIVALGAGAAATVTATNTFEVSSITVTKKVTGDLDAEGARGVFTVELQCTVGGASIEIPGGEQRMLRVEGGYEVTFSDLPTGADCIIVETETGGALRTSIIVAGADTVDGTSADVTAVGHVQVEITNEFVKDLPKTGLSIPPLLWAAIPLTLFAGIALLLIGTRRRREEV
ncbi:DUF5979 domain-containing protein [Microbacterium sp. A84]|uniref:DUF5979 domain-containing protein n=1 Tax=Microbacterium sp. A84 TaxID=3450715 RepID=UPI003F42DF98